MSDGAEPKRRARSARGKPGSHGKPEIVTYPLPGGKLARFRRIRSPKAQTSGGGFSGEGSADDLDQAIAELNSRFFMLTIGGMVSVATFELNRELGRNQLVFIRQQDFILKFRNRQFPSGRFKGNGEPIVRDLGSLWTNSPQRREYERAEMICSGPCPADTLNLWRGWGCMPKRGSFSTIEDHVRNVICAGDDRAYAYLLRLLARWVQEPGAVGEVAIVLRGKKGAGKGQFNNLLARWFRHHCSTVTQPEHLTGRFNSHMVDTLFLFADEVTWGGDKQADGPLKSLITEKTLRIEGKGRDTFQVANRIKLLISSNSDWVVPATADERRYFVLDVSEGRLGNHEYFSKLVAAIEGAEGQALLAHLLELDLADFNHRAVPNTAGLTRQKLEGLDSLGKFWLDCLTLGEIVNHPGEFAPWPQAMKIADVYSAYCRSAEAMGQRRKVSQQKFFNETRDKYMCSFDRGRKLGEPRYYSFPALAQARQEFLWRMNINDDVWPENDD